MFLSELFSPHKKKLTRESFAQSAQNNRKKKRESAKSGRFFIIIIIFLLLLFFLIVVSEKSRNFSFTVAKMIKFMSIGTSSFIDENIIYRRWLDGGLIRGFSPLLSSTNWIPCAEEC